MPPEPLPPVNPGASSGLSLALGSLLKGLLELLRARWSVDAVPRRTRYSVHYREDLGWYEQLEPERIELHKVLDGLPLDDVMAGEQYRELVHLVRGDPRLAQPPTNLRLAGLCQA